MALRRLVLVLGDQLNRDSAVFDDFDPDRDCVWMAEVIHEATYVPAHKRRLVLFFSAMRHFRDMLREEGVEVRYHALGADASRDRGTTFEEVLRNDLEGLKPERVVVAEPGDWRVWRSLEDTAKLASLALEVRVDRHFYCGIDEFREWAGARKGLVMEYFYRAMRRRHNVLVDGNEPEGGAWNFDRDNRESFGRAGPGEMPELPVFPADRITQNVAAVVEKRFAAHPGSTEGFDLPVTADAAEWALDRFIGERLADFGHYQDALWTDERFLYHSRLSAAINLHLIRPARCIDAAINAYRRGRAPLNAVEGFVRQILGWREFVRGVYWLYMPDYANRNALNHRAGIPSMLWTGETDMACVADAMTNVLANGYAHHIQRLMVLGLFAQLYGVHPYAFHEWHMAMYLDAVDWVSLPNTLGMSQFGDGGLLGTKPYCASGAYLQRMSNYCRHCRYQPKRAYGEDACPITTLYWSFLDRHAERFEGNRRMVFQLKNLERRRAKGELEPVRRAAKTLRRRISDGRRV